MTLRIIDTLALRCCCIGLSTEWSTCWQQPQSGQRH